MNRILLTLKRPFIWLYRFRHRCGYGVHSPFAFNLITHVIYESTAYYKYEELAKAQKQLELEKDKRWKYESKKVKRLLFRLVNYTCPLFESGEGGGRLYFGFRPFRALSGEWRSR